MNHVYDTYEHSILGTYQAMLGQFDLSQVSATANATQIITVLLFVLFTIAVNIVMLNLLIAIMSNTYQEVQDKAEQEYFAELVDVIAETQTFFIFPFHHSFGHFGIFKFF